MCMSLHTYVHIYTYMHKQIHLLFLKFCMYVYQIKTIFIYLKLYFKLLTYLTLLKLNSNVYFHFQITFLTGQMLLSKLLSDPSLRIENVLLTFFAVVCGFHAAFILHNCILNAPPAFHTRTTFHHKSYYPINFNPLHLRRRVSKASY